MKKEFTFLSADGVTRIHAIQWKPQGEIKAVLQLCHGMVEYIDRYDAFAASLNKRGICVIGHDHLGHGMSVSNQENYGFFHHSKGNEMVIADIRRLFLYIEKQFPHIPHFMLGHSMGSFLLRQYIQQYPKDIDGAIIMGTGYHSKAECMIGIILCRILQQIKGDHYRSAFVNKMAFGSYNSSFKPSRTDYDWLTRDEQIVDAYQAHPWCTFIFTVNAYLHMLRGILALTDKKKRRNISREMPVLFVSGGDDPVGGFGKGVKKVYQQFQKLQINDLSLKLYPKGRHEILNEINRLDVFTHIGDWLEERIPLKER